ncbi:MAG: hypothetical protein ACPGD5_00750 [Salibacteraceae bacterium]
MILKKVLGIIAVVFLTTSLVNAQKPNHGKSERNPEMRLEKRLEHLKSELELSNSQVQEVSEILKNSLDKSESIKNKYPEVKEAKMELREVREFRQQKVSVILTKDQLELLKKEKKGYKKIDRSFERDYSNRVNEMKTRLDLTETQAKELKQINEEVSNRKIEIAKKYPELKNMKEEMRSLRKESKQEILKVLNSDQKEKFERMKKGSKRN